MNEQKSEPCPACGEAECFDHALRTKPTNNPQPPVVAEAPDDVISFDYHEDADALPSVQQLRVDRQQWLRTFCLHSGVHWDGRSPLSESEQIRLLKAEIEPECCNSPDLGYYLRHAAYRFAEAQRQFREGHHEYQTLIDVIHRQRYELARLNEQVRGLAKDAVTTPDSIAEKARRVALRLKRDADGMFAMPVDDEPLVTQWATIITTEFGAGGGRGGDKL